MMAVEAANNSFRYRYKKLLAGAGWMIITLKAERSKSPSVDDGYDNVEALIKILKGEIIFIRDDRAFYASYYNGPPGRPIPVKFPPSENICQHCSLIGARVCRENPTIMRQSEWKL